MPWLPISIVVGIVIIGLLVGYIITYRNKPKPPVDYYMMFVMGIIWTGAGVSIMISTHNPGLLGMGIIFMLMGITHRKQWKTNHRRYADLSPEEKRFKLWGIIVLLLLVVLGVFFFIALR